MTVRRKLACSVAALLLISGGSAVVSLSARQRTLDALTALRDIQRRQQALSSTDRELELRWREIRVLRELSPSGDQIAVLRERLSALDTRARDVGRASQATTFGASYQPLIASWLDVLAALETSDIRGIPLDPGAVLAALDALREQNDRRADEASVRFQLAMHAAERTTLGLLLASALCGSVIVVVLSLTVSRGLAALQNASRHVEAGDYAFRIAPRGRDEFADAARTFNEMATALAAAIDETRRARDEAQQASEAKSSFLTSMSHDLRTPLTAVLGYVDLIEADARRTGSHSTAADSAQLRRSALVLLGMIGELLDLARLEAGRMPICLDAVDVGDLVEEVAGTMRPLIEQRGNTLTVRADNPRAVVTDRCKLRHVLQNLLGNACKFTEAGEIAVDVTYGANAAGVPSVQLCVADSGIGMSAEAAARVFQPYEQGSAEVRQRFGGSGLGLTITRGFVELLGGTIAVESVPGQGATFTVWLPDRLESAEHGAFEAEASEAAALFAAIDAERRTPAA